MKDKLKKSYYPKRWLRICGAVLLLASLSIISFILGILFQQTQSPPPVQVPNLPPVEEPVVSYPHDKTENSLSSGSFEDCVEKGGEIDNWRKAKTTTNALIRKVCVYNNQVFKQKCFSNKDYLVIEKEQSTSYEKNILIKYKTDKNRNYDCQYKVESGDFEFKEIWVNYTSPLALVNNLLILDIGTSPEPRGLSIYNLDLQKEVYKDSYSSPVTIEENKINYWTEKTNQLSEQDCPELNNLREMGLSSAIDTHVSLNLTTFQKEELGESRCASRQY